MTKYNLPFFILIIYIILFIWSGVAPVDRGVWIVESITSFVPVAILIYLYFTESKFSNLAYIMMGIFPIMHIIGAHYTFANVPFDLFNHLFGFTRNMYDRVAHMTVGFYAFGISEFLFVKNLVNSKFVAWTYALFTIMAIAAAYEIFEWQYAIYSDPSAGIAVLGAQGDVWDAQKDMLMDTIGAAIGVILFNIPRLNRIR